MTTLTFQVSESDTAIALGSGDVPVLATPRLLAWFEAATVQAAAEHVGEGQTSVGVEVSMQHLRATAVGGRVLVAVSTAEVRDGRAQFDVIAYQLADAVEGSVPEQQEWADGTLRPGVGPGISVIATGRIVRAFVDRDAFLARLARH